MATSAWQAATVVYSAAGRRSAGQDAFGKRKGSRGASACELERAGGPSMTQLLELVTAGQKVPVRHRVLPNPMMHA